jgi:hypothetical protein
MSNLVSITGGKDTAPKNIEKCNAVEEVEKLLTELKAQENIPYNRAVIVLVSDEADDPREHGFRTATINCPAFTGIGILEMAQTSLIARLVE